MAPMMLDDRAQHATVPATIRGNVDLYPHIDEKILHEDATSCLANYGTKFESAIVTGTKGLYFYVNGRPVLDWTSGQVRASCIRDRICTETNRCHV